MEGDGRDDADGSFGPAETAELEQAVRRSGERAPATLDRRVAELFEAEPASSTARTSGAPRLRARRLATAAAVVVGCGAFAWAATELRWFTGESETPLVAPTDGPIAHVSDGSDAAPSLATDAPDLPWLVPTRVALPADVLPDAPLESVAVELDDWDAVAAESSGPARSLDARATFREAPVLARLRLVGRRARSDRDGRSFDRPVAEVERVYRGDPVLAGRKVELHRHVGRPAAASFLAWTDECFDPRLEPDLSWVATFDVIERDALPDGTLHAQQLLAEQWNGTWLARGLPERAEPPADDAAASAELLGDLAASLVAGLERNDARLLRSTVAALFRFDGDASQPRPDSLVWRDGAARAALLRAGRDGDARERRQVAALNPAAAGSEGVALLRALLFDRDPEVRQPAWHWLATTGVASLDAARRELGITQDDVAQWRRGDDGELDSLLSAAFGPPRRLFSSDGLVQYLATLDRTAPAEVRREQALDLGHLHPPEAVAALLGYLDDPDRSVRLAAATGLAPCGESERVRERLLAVPDHEEPCVQALVGYAQIVHGDTRGGERLARLLRAGDVRSSVMAARLLGEAAAFRGFAATVGPLLGACRHPDPRVRGEVMASLERVATRSRASADEMGEVLAAWRLAESDGSPLVRAAATVAIAEWQRPVKHDEGNVLDVDELRHLQKIGYGGEAGDGGGDR